MSINDYTKLLLNKVRAQDWKLNIFWNVKWSNFCDIHLTVFRCSMRALQVAEHIQHLYSSLVHIWWVCNYSSSYPPSKFLQSWQKWWNVNSILSVPPKENHVMWSQGNMVTKEQGKPLPFKFRVIFNSPDQECENAGLDTLTGIAWHSLQPCISFRNPCNMSRYITSHSALGKK